MNDSEECGGVLDLIFPEIGDAMLVLSSPRMLEGKDGVLMPGVLLDPQMALELANLLAAWATGMGAEDA